MSQTEFNHLLETLSVLTPDQLDQLRRQLDRQSASIPRAASVTRTETVPADKPLWEQILEMTAEVPDEEWAKLPTDGAEQHDHYIYGTPKRPTAQ